MGTRMGTFLPTFDRKTLQLLGNAEMLTTQSEGVSRFDGRGGWTASARALTLFHGRLTPGDTPIIPGPAITCKGSYLVDPDLSFRIYGACKNGPLTFSPFRIGGHISRDRKTLILSDTAPTVEEVSLEGVGVIAEQVCTALATDIRALRTD